MTTEQWKSTEQVEVRSERDRLVATGVAMRYDARSKPIRESFREVFAPGAFTQTLQQQDVRSHNEHGGPYLGRTSNASLRLTDSATELIFELDLPNTSAGRDAAALLERRDIKGSSIGFRAIAKEVTWGVEDGLALRSVGRAALHFIDLTVDPVYDDSTADLALRSFAVSTGLDFRSVIDAAERGELVDLINARPEVPIIGAPGEPEAAPTGEPQDGPVTPAVISREHISWLYA